MKELARITETLPDAYKALVATVKDSLPAAERDAANFHKAHSQFMVATLDVTPLTPIRSIMQTLAEIERTRRALEEAHIRRLNLLTDEAEQRTNLETLTMFDRQRAETRLIEIGYQVAALDNSVQGAVRKLAHLCSMHKSLLSHIGRDEITEGDYEAEEARYHVLTCLKQALCAARSRGGVIDEGNHIYLFDMGMPAALVQKHVLDYLQHESEMIANGQAPTHSHTLDWMNRVADQIEPYARENAQRRGVCLLDKDALIGDKDGLSAAQY